MDYIIAKSSSSLKIVTLFLGLMLGIFFTSSAKATSTETNTSHNPKMMQLAYYGYYHRHRGWCYYHPRRCHHRYYWRYRY